MPGAAGDRAGVSTKRMGSTIFCRVMGGLIRGRWGNVYGSKDVQGR